jgi:hypothetical protein
METTKHSDRRWPSGLIGGESAGGGTRRKHGKKEPQSFVHCGGSFDHPDLHSLNDYKFVFFWVY